MIVNAKQYEELLQEQLRHAAPSLWNLLNSPQSILDLHPGRFERLQTKARQELRRITKFEAPARGYLE